MATLTLNNRGCIMATEGDSGWVSLFGLGTSIVTFVLGGFGAIMLRGVNWASSEGRAKGEMAGWQVLMDAKVNVTNEKMVAMETRLNSRMDVIETHSDSINEQFRSIPTRAEMNDGFDRLARQIERLDDFIHQPESGKRRGDS